MGKLYVCCKCEKTMHVPSGLGLKYFRCSHCESWNDIDPSALAREGFIDSVGTARLWSGEAEVADA